MEGISSVTTRTRRNDSVADVDRPEAVVGQRFSINVSSDRVWRLQKGAITAIVVVSTVLQLAYLSSGDMPGLRFVAWFFFVDTEHTIPPLYSTLILFCCAALAFVVGSVSGASTGNWGWRALAAVLALAGLDEYAAIHERAIDPIQDILKIESGPLFYAWVLPGAAAVLLLGAVFSGFLRRLPADTRNRYLVAGALFVAGAIGVEMVGASYVTGTFGALEPGVDPDAARASLIYVAITTVEETLELVGAALFLTATVAHVENHLGRRLLISLPLLAEQVEARQN